MFGIGTTEMVVILVISMMVFGIGRLPEVGEGIGKALSGFKKGVKELHDEERKELKD